MWQQGLRNIVLIKRMMWKLHHCINMQPTWAQGTAWPPFSPMKSPSYLTLTTLCPPVALPYCLVLRITPYHPDTNMLSGNDGPLELYPLAVSVNNTNRQIHKHTHTRFQYKHNHPVLFCFFLNQLALRTFDHLDQKYQHFIIFSYIKVLNEGNWTCLNFFKMIHLASKKVIKPRTRTWTNTWTGTKQTLVQCCWSGLRKQQSLKTAPDSFFPPKTHRKSLPTGKMTRLCYITNKGINKCGEWMTEKSQ